MLCQLRFHLSAACPAQCRFFTEGKQSAASKSYSFIGDLADSGSLHAVNIMRWHAGGERQHTMASSLSAASWRRPYQDLKLQGLRPEQHLLGTRCMPASMHLSKSKNWCHALCKRPFTLFTPATVSHRHASYTSSGAHTPTCSRLLTDH